MQISNPNLLQLIKLVYLIKIDHLNNIIHKGYPSSTVVRSVNMINIIMILILILLLVN